MNYIKQLQADKTEAFDSARSVETEINDLVSYLCGDKDEPIKCAVQQRKKSRFYAFHTVLDFPEGRQPLRMDAGARDEWLTRTPRSGKHEIHTRFSSRRASHRALLLGRGGPAVQRLTSGPPFEP